MLVGLFIVSLFLTINKCLFAQFESIILIHINFVIRLVSWIHQSIHEVLIWTTLILSTSLRTNKHLNLGDTFYLENFLYGDPISITIAKGLGQHSRLIILKKALDVVQIEPEQGLFCAYSSL